MTPTPTTYRLAGNEDFTDSVNAYTFGYLITLADGVVKRYHSDLYRDAQWLEKHLTGPMTFYYVVRENGTHIGCDLQALEICHGTMGGVLYEITLRQERGFVWMLDITVLKTDQKEVAV